jgi:hypothetical protein
LAHISFGVKLIGFEPRFGKLTLKEGAVAIVEALNIRLVWFEIDGYILGEVFQIRKDSDELLTFLGV